MGNDFSHLGGKRRLISAASRVASLSSFWAVPARLWPATMRCRAAWPFISSLSAQARRHPQRMISRSIPGEANGTISMSARPALWVFICLARADRSISGLQDPQNLSAILI